MPPEPLSEALLDWFDGQGRDLPWRNRPDAYRILVSEFMLQQTRSDTAASYFLRFLERLPTLESLAEAPRDQVLKLWEGLGYYQRAHRLHETARILIEHEGGVIPRSEEALRRLPGIGPYSAAAIASIAFGTRALAIDGNVRRVASRLAMLASPDDESVRTVLGPAQPADRAGAFNEALMDLGATVCLPRDPRCPQCPLRKACQACHSGIPGAYPKRPQRAALPLRKRYAWIHLATEGLWLRKRSRGELLAGLWGFPQSEQRPSGTDLPGIDHLYTHFRLRLVPVLTETTPTGEGGRFVTSEELPALALSRADHKVLALLRRKGVLPHPPGDVTGERALRHDEEGRP